MKYVVTVRDTIKKETNTYWNITEIKTETTEDKIHFTLYCGDIEIKIPAVYKHKLNIEITEDD